MGAFITRREPQKLGVLHGPPTPPPPADWQR